MGISVCVINYLLYSYASPLVRAEAHPALGEVLNGI